MGTLVLGDKLFLAPVDNPKKVLDVGTGQVPGPCKSANKYLEQLPQRLFNWALTTTPFPVLSGFISRC